MNAIKTDFRAAQLDAPTRAMLEFAEKSTAHPSEICPVDVQRLRECGFVDEDILDIVHITAYFNYINRVADSLGVDAEPNFEPMEKITPQRAKLLQQFRDML